MRTIIALIVIVVVVGVFLVVQYRKATPPIPNLPDLSSTEVTPTPPYPLSIASMRSRQYRGGDIQITEDLDPGVNYSRHIASYESDGLTIYALLTIPTGSRPQNGWPVVVFNHGYIPPEQYRTTERYVAYVHAFARSGYIVFKPDYRGHGDSEGAPEGAYYSPAYTVDVLNAVASIKKYPSANPDRIGMWGHSLGGNITLRSIVVRPFDIQAAVIWAGVVGSYDDLVNRWHRSVPYRPSPRELALRNSSRQKIFEQYGSPSANHSFWDSIDPTKHLQDVETPVQIHHGTADAEVPYAFAQSLDEKLRQVDKVSELFLYEGADHNISDPYFTSAMNRSVAFFDTYLKE